MHPYVAGELIRGREQELRRSARRYTSHRRLRRWLGSIRNRAGWLLIEIGLALAQGSGDQVRDTRGRPRT
jgi:hypothetical protein